MNTYTIDARTVPADRDGWESSGRQVPTFRIEAPDAESAARAACRVLLDAHPGIESATATASDGTRSGTASMKALRNGRVFMQVESPII